MVLIFIFIFLFFIFGYVLNQIPDKDNKVINKNQAEEILNKLKQVEVDDLAFFNDENKIKELTKYIAREKGKMDSHELEEEAHLFMQGFESQLFDDFCFKTGTKGYKMKISTINISNKLTNAFNDFVVLLNASNIESEGEVFLFFTKNFSVFLKKIKSNKLQKITNVLSSQIITLTTELKKKYSENSLVDKLYMDATKGIIEYAQSFGFPDAYFRALFLDNLSICKYFSEIINDDDIVQKTKPILDSLEKFKTEYLFKEEDLFI